jgi:3-hydroxyisobutyrate dehydrogenase
MGGPMCTNLVERCGRPVVCLDRSAETCALPAERGALVAEDIDAVAGSCEIVFLCLASAQATREVATALLRRWSPASMGRVIVDTGTTSLGLTRELAVMASAAGHRYIDAPVARMPAAAVAGTLSFMVGADDESFARVEPLLRCMGTDITRCGAPGSGQIVKILHNTLLFETVHAVAEALAVAHRHGVDGAVLLDAIALGSANCDAARVQGRSSLLPRRYPGDRFTTRYAMKDIGLALELAEQARMDLTLAPATLDLLRRTRDAGWGDQYYTALYELLIKDAEDVPSPQDHNHDHEADRPTERDR